MSEVGIRALKQNASAVVAAAAQGETVVITDRGRRVAQMTALAASPLRRLADAGRLRPPKSTLESLGLPTSSAELSAALAEARDAERY